MKDTFCGCSKLKILPDISEWTINNVESLEGLFYECSSLNSLPDISKWNTKNTINMNLMFYKCSSFNRRNQSLWITAC